MRKWSGKRFFVHDVQNNAGDPFYESAVLAIRCFKVCLKTLAKRTLQFGRIRGGDAFCF
jgi:hypothetical protein